jgi:quercetin dioxygenase-like cupin family protein
MVTHSRRDLAWLATAFAAQTAAGQQAKLASKTYRYEDLTVRRNGENAQRAILRGGLHTGFEIEMHETELAPGKAPHASHHHVHEEMIMIREGTMEVTIAGNTSRLGPGSVAFVASNEEHGWRNVGETRARYFVLALGRDLA